MSVDNLAFLLYMQSKINSQVRAPIKGGKKKKDLPIGFRVVINTDDNSLGNSRRTGFGAILRSREGNLIKGGLRVT